MVFTSPLRSLGKYPPPLATSTSVNNCYQKSKNIFSLSIFRLHFSAKSRKSKNIRLLRIPTKQILKLQNYFKRGHLFVEKFQRYIYMDSLACKLKQPLLLAPRGQGSVLLSDRKTVQKLSRILAIVTEQQTKDIRSQKSNINTMSLINSYSWICLKMANEASSAELAIIISCPTSTSGIIVTVLIKNAHKVSRIILEFICKNKRTRR